MANLYCTYDSLRLLPWSWVVMAEFDSDLGLRQTTPHTQTLNLRLSLRRLEGHRVRVVRKLRYTKLFLP